MKMQNRLGGTLAALAVATGSAQASPLELQYSVSAGAGGLYNYDFTLTLDNHTNDWAPGEKWSCIIFGDTKLSNSPLADFAPTSAVPAPFDEMDMAGGN